MKGPCNSAPKQISELTHVASSFVIGSELVGDSCKGDFSIKFPHNVFDNNELHKRNRGVIEKSVECVKQ